jgi:hypothetical protein
LPGLLVHDPHALAEHRGCVVPAARSGRRRTIALPGRRATNHGAHRTEHDAVTHAERRTFLDESTQMPSLARLRGPRLVRHEGAVGGAEVLDDERVTELHDGVPARDGFVVDPDLVALCATDGGAARGRQLENAKLVAPYDDQLMASLPGGGLLRS